MDDEPRPLWDIIVIGLETGQETVLACGKSMDDAETLVQNHISTQKSDPVFFSWRFHSTENAS